ncbi:MAG: hypothetical protein IIY07_06300, partial [Thermoguttaceae bacterium]|nr:hypothetical protein [Thermoguttaceae bacterium]
MRPFVSTRQFRRFAQDLDAILALNPDAHFIQVALMNAYEEKGGTVAEGTLGKLVETIYTPMNVFLENLPKEER